MKDTIKKLLKEELDKTITCKNKKCGWHWKHSQGGPDMYFCHKCGTDNTPDNINEAATGKEVTQFLLDFGSFISMNLMKIQTRAKDENSKVALAQMQQKLRSPIINGKTFFELADPIITPKKILFNPKFLSGVFTQVRSYLVYVKEHIIRFVEDGDTKKAWLDRIATFEERYKNIIGGNQISEETNMIDEAAAQMGDLPKDAGLFISDNGTWLNFTLYSKSEDKIYGVITTSDLNGSNKIQEVGRVAAEKGYGPLMYEIAMGYINPGFLMPSRDGDIRSEAWNVWKKFYQRKDIIKKPLEIQDELFSFIITTGDSHEDFDSPEEKQEMFDELSKYDKESIVVFNTMYQYNNPMILKLIYKADEQVKNDEVNISKLKHTAAEYFSQKYA